MAAGKASRRELEACCKPPMRQARNDHPSDDSGRPLGIAGDPGCAAGRAEAVYAVDADRGRGGDALIEEKILAAPDAGIVIDLRRKQANDGAQALAAMEGLRADLGGQA